MISFKKNYFNKKNAHDQFQQVACRAASSWTNIVIAGPITISSTKQS